MVAPAQLLNVRTETWDTLYLPIGEVTPGSFFLRLNNSQLTIRSKLMLARFDRQRRRLLSSLKALPGLLAERTGLSELPHRGHGL
jgi:hypothetical protein